MRRGWSGVLLGGVLLLASRGAQAQTPYEPNIDMQTFRPAPGPYNFLTVAGSRVQGRVAPSFGAWVNWGYQPLTIYEANCPSSTNDDGCTRGAVRSRPIEHLATLNILAGVTLFDRLFLSVDVPLTLETGDAVDANTLRPVVGVGGTNESQTHAGLGDPRIEARLRIAGRGLTGAGLAASVWGTIPSGRFTGADDHFIAERNVTLGGRLIADYRVGRFAVAGNVGAVWRPDTLTVLSTSVGSRLTWGAAVGVDISTRLGVIAEGYGSSNFTGGSASQNHTVEGNLAARYTLGDVTLTAGGGSAFLRGAGGPVARAFVGFGWAPYRVDEDNDGVNDNHDRCPSEPEDHDGFEDDDGCPDPYNDGDGVPDAEDQCSEQAAGANPDPERRGCPTVVADRDNDGVPDARDRCPDQPETVNGVEDDDGCPEANAPTLATVVGDQIQITEQVNFRTGSDRIVGRRSFEVLDAVAAVLRAHAEIARVEVQGHTDNRGNAGRNRALSQRRAEAVRQYLVAHGVSADRLSARGFGPDQPLESNSTEAGRARNRRVEFHFAPQTPPAQTPAAQP